jgi:hypothetical protein
LRASVRRHRRAQGDRSTLRSIRPTRASGTTHLSSRLTRKETNTPRNLNRAAGLLRRVVRRCCAPATWLGPLPRHASRTLRPGGRRAALPHRGDQPVTPGHRVPQSPSTVHPRGSSGAGLAGSARRRHPRRSDWRVPVVPRCLEDRGSAKSGRTPRTTGPRVEPHTWGSGMPGVGLERRSIQRR